MQSILSQLTLQLLTYFQNDMHPSCSVLPFDMEDSVYKMIKMPDNCQSGSQLQVNMEDIVNKMFKKCSKIPIIVRVDPTQDASSGTIEVREHCTRGRQRLMLLTFLIN